MFSSIRKRQGEARPASLGNQSKRICTGDSDKDDQPGTSFEIEDTSLPVAYHSDSSDDECDSVEGQVQQTKETLAPDESHKPPGPDDISQYPLEGPTQPNIAFPVKKQGCNRSFKSSWYKVHPWLEYSERCDAAFCFACRHFLVPTLRTEEAFTSTGVSNWKKALGKKGKISKHVVADYHVNAMVAWASFKESRKVGSVLEQLSESYKKEILENRHFVKTVAEVLLVTGAQNIAQRGHREDEESDNAGNLRRILSLVSSHDKVIKKRLEGGPRNAKYTSPEIQNDMLKTLAQMVREQILKEIHASKQFSILVDETKDVRKTEQLALVVRYYHEGQITESFLCFKNADGLDAQSLRDVVIGLISGFALDNRVNLVGQGYDGAAVMSGAVSGVAKRIQVLAPSAVYVHCYAHRLNLVIVDACKTVKEAANFFALLQQLYVFVSGSNVHQRWLQTQAEMFTEKQPRELKRLSDTRWACRADARVVLKTRLQAILRLLHHISEDDNAERVIEATGLLAQMDEQFTARLVSMTVLLQKTKSLSTMLQQDDVDLSAASHLATVVIDEKLQDMRSNDDTFYEIWHEVGRVVNDC
ncbi:putative zinc finger MYM-type protein 1-like [Apostichopus japonicus]|uniref:Putative zinc finger MYM-type protein 1-like n=1 Tax=Stichopus japonicus TaxID=307972 RepID=A0A2G8KUU9_STIJA|nr:putative zinc finger MYM-type protein 1-like [Apostichopus japonicus]